MENKKSWQKYCIAIINFKKRKTDDNSSINNNNANRSNIVKNNQKESNHTLICNDIKQAIDVSVRPSKEKCDISSSTNLLHKKWSFPLRISPVNRTKSAVSCGFGHIYWRTP